MRQAYQVEGTNILDLLNEHSVAIHSCQHVPFFLSKKVIGRDTPVVSLSTQSTHFIIYEDDSAVSWILEAVPRAMPSECPAIPTLLHPQLLESQHPHLPQVQRGSSSHENKNSSGSMATMLMLQTGCIMCRPVWEMTMLGPWFSINKNLESAAAEHHTHHGNLPRARPWEIIQVSGQGSQPAATLVFYLEILRGEGTLPPYQRGLKWVTVNREPSRKPRGSFQESFLCRLEGQSKSPPPLAGGERAPTGAGLWEGDECL